MSKILCPFHADTNPSMELYDDGHGYCFVCGKSTKMLGALTAGPASKKEAENIQESIAAIKRLPAKWIRGLWMHYSDDGYYVIWPNDEYYKMRTYSGKPRYIAPTGHTPPLLWAKDNFPVGNDTLIIIEGEINALSLAMVVENCDIVSPGASTNFHSKEADLLKVASGYDNVVVWTDYDSAGIHAIWGLLPVLCNRGIKASQITPELDANDMLMKYGIEVFKDVFNNVMKDFLR